MAFAEAEDIKPIVQNNPSRASWIRGMFSWNWKNFLGAGDQNLSMAVFEEKQKAGCKDRDDGVCSSWSLSRSDTEPPEKVMKHTCKTLTPTEVNVWQRKIDRRRDYQRQYKSTAYSSSDSDRLNLNHFILPPLKKSERIEQWIDQLEYNMKNLCSTTESPDGLCECNQSSVEKKKKLIMDYILKSAEEVAKLQKTLQSHADNREKEFQLLSGLTKANEELKLEIVECATRQRDILEKFVHQSTRLDIEFDVEERILAAQAEENLQKIQDKLCTDIVKKESSSMVRLFTGI